GAWQRFREFVCDLPPFVRSCVNSPRICPPREALRLPGVDPSAHQLEPGGPMRDVFQLGQVRDSDKGFTRRDLARVAALLAAGARLASCPAPAPATLCTAPCWPSHRPPVPWSSPSPATKPPQAPPPSSRRRSSRSPFARIIPTA